MKATELIKKLQSMVAANGDAEVVPECEDDNDDFVPWSRRIMDMETDFKDLYRGPKGEVVIPVDIPKKKEGLVEPKEKVKQAFEQYQEGAITYVDFVRFAWSQVTPIDVHDHNEGLDREVFMVPSAEDVGRRAEWPFEG